MDSQLDPPTSLARTLPPNSYDSQLLLFFFWFEGFGIFSVLFIFYFDSGCAAPFLYKCWSIFTYSSLDLSFSLFSHFFKFSRYTHTHIHKHCVDSQIDVHFASSANAWCSNLDKSKSLECWFSWKALSILKISIIQSFYNPFWTS